MPQISPCPQPTTTLMGQRCPAVTPTRPCAAVTRWDEEGDVSHTRAMRLVVDSDVELKPKVNKQAGRGTRFWVSKFSLFAL